MAITRVSDASLTQSKTRWKNFGGNWNNFPGGNQTADTIVAFAENLVARPAAAVAAGGTLTIDGVALGSYDYTIKVGNQTVSSFVSGDWFTATKDTRSAFIVVNGDLTINSGQTFIPPDRKLFTCIYVKGNLVVNGSISMSQRGANHSGTGDSGGYTAPGNIKILADGTQIPATGGAGGSGATNSTGNAGGAGSVGGTAGGASGTGDNSATGGNGAAGTSFGGGSAGGSRWASGQAASAVANGGRAGDASTGGSGTIGGSAGNPGGNGVNGGAAGGTGNGGVLIIFVTGNYSGSGSITAAGSNGSGGTRGGGGSGGGSVNIFVRGTDTGPTPTATGGSGGSGSEFGPAKAGGNGTARKLTF